ncbi:MAG: sugar nucleotidyltransferase [Acidimicrobiales bacterium]
MKGIVLAGGRATRLGPASRAVSKQLMMVYDKPLVYHPISTLLLAGINEMLIITTPEEQPRFQALLGDGRSWGCEFSYAIQVEPRGLADAFVIGADYIAGEPVALILGDNMFHGVGLGEQLQKFTEPDGAVVFALWVPDPQRYGVVEFDGDSGRPLAIHEKPVDPPSHYAVPGLYFYDGRVADVAATLTPSARGEIEITTLNNWYLEQGALEVCALPFAVEWFDVGTFDAMLDAQNWAAGEQRRKGLLIGSPEAAAYRGGFIDADQVRRLAAAADDNGDLASSGYGERLLRILDFA